MLKYIKSLGHYNLDFKMFEIRIKWIMVKEGNHFVEVNSNKCLFGVEIHFCEKVIQLLFNQTSLLLCGAIVNKIDLELKKNIRNHEPNSLQTVLIKKKLD